MKLTHDLFELERGREHPVDPKEDRLVLGQVSRMF
jgi:hypothetical protein